MIPLLVSIRKTASKVCFSCFSGVVIFLTLMMFVAFGLLPDSVNVIIKWICLFVAVSGLYNATSSLLKAGGAKGLPEGNPFFK